jgi:hypothetical protein
VPIVATVTLRDSFNRQTRKKLETETDVLATAQSAVGALITTLLAVSDLGVDLVTYSFKDTGDAAVPTAGSNVDTGATIQGRVASGELVAVKIPGIKATMVGANGSVDVTGTEVAAYLDNFETAGAFTVSDGETVTEWVRGELDR